MKLLVAISFILTIAFTSLLTSANGFANTISIMTYNAENLFDTRHDAGRSDYKWMSAAYKKKNNAAREYCLGLKPQYVNYCLNYDWSNKTLSVKIKNLSRAIRAYHGFKAPDIIVLQEVENKRVLTQLVEDGLYNEGYRFVGLIEGPDNRGIDIGIISRFPVVKHKLHPISLTGTSSRGVTRGVYEAVFNINGKTLSVLGNHWPSQMNRDDTRLRASEVLKKVALKSKSDIVVATGDFNQNPSDSPHGIKKNILPYFYNVETIARKNRLRGLNKGTHWYRGHWTSLDKFFVLKKSVRSKAAKILWTSFDIINNSFLMKLKYEWTDDLGVLQTESKIPYRFSTTELKGYSDHLPVAFELEL